MSVGDRLRAIAQQATPGPWGVRGSVGWHVVAESPRGIIARISGGASVEADKADAALIALAPELATLAADMADALERVSRHNMWDVSDRPIVDDALQRFRALTSQEPA